MRKKNSLNQRFGGIGWWKGLAAFSILVFWAMQLSAQKVVVMTNADLGKVVVATHHYSEADQVFKLVLKHRLTGIGPIQLSLMKTTQFEKGPFELKTELPAIIRPEESLEVEFGINYGKSVQQENTISLLAVAAGEAASIEKGIAINIKLTADPKLMFWNERKKQYAKSLPALEFQGAGEQLIELTWNGSGNGQCVYSIEDDGKPSFSLIPNRPGGTTVSSGSSLNLSKGGNSFFVKYEGNANRNRADIARMRFSEPGGQSLSLDLMGTYQGGTPLFASAKELLSKNNLKGGYQPVASTDGNGKEAIKNAAGDENGKETIKNAYVGLDKNVDGGASENGENAGPIKDAATNAGASVADGMGKPNNGGNITPSPRANSQPSIRINVNDDGALSSDEAIERLGRYYLRHRDENLIKLGQARFDKADGIYEARIPVGIDSLFEDPNFHITPIWVSVKTAQDSVSLPMSNVIFLEDSLLLRVKLSAEAVDQMSKQDSFEVMAGFMPEYISGNTPYYLVDQTQIFQGKSYAKMYSNSRWLYFLIAGLVGLFLLFFVIGFMWSRQPITTFRYLREARYQRERHKSNSERQRVDVETVHIDLAKHETDLIQLAFIERGEDLDGKGGISAEKVRTILSTVPTPLHGGLKRFFVWLYGPFGRKREPKFRSVYYSLRVELVKGGIPNNLRMKDESGMIMLGTTLTGNVLATDHQDFKFNQRPFSYSIYLDPSEFVDYSGAMRSVTIPFRVVEEPFEGYVMTREFNLNLEIAQRY